MGLYEFQREHQRFRHRR